MNTSFSGTKIFETMVNQIFGRKKRKLWRNILENASFAALGYKDIRIVKLEFETIIQFLCGTEN